VNVRHPLRATQQPPEGYIPTSAACLRLGVRKSVVDSLRAENRLDSVRIGRARYYSVGSIERVKNEREQAALDREAARVAKRNARAAERTDAQVTAKAARVTAKVPPRGSSMVPLKPRSNGTGVIPSNLSRAARVILGRTRAARVELDALLEDVKSETESVAA
jgi:hypothetical protein